MARAPEQTEFQKKVKRTFKVFREEFLPRVKITSKELLTPSPMTLYKSQEYAYDKVEEGLLNDVHDAKFLKARQLGISTAFLPLDIFWLYTNPGLQGALIADTGDNKETFRETITQMLEGLPKAYRIPIKSHNRNALVLGNGSRLQYMSAGRGRNSGLGRSRALNFIHATECSSWGDQKGLDSLRASLAREHPNRLYLWESTALGQNLWFDMCQEAKDDDEQSLVFIGWWMKDIYRIDRTSQQYAKWWGQSPELTEYEQQTGQEVLDKYSHQITTEQWAWYRREQDNKSGESMNSEFPSTELEAWVTTGSNFFNNRRVDTDVNFARNYARFHAYNITFGLTFSSLKIEEVFSATDADLKVWEEPRKDARYVIGMDVAYGLSETNDRTVIEVFRCFGDKMVQVAEYATSQPETQQAAWVLAWLCGCYRDCRVNLEINGPGMQVMLEMKNLKRQIEQRIIRDIPVGLNVQRSLDTMRWYLWHRPDSMGAGYVYGWKTAWDNKLFMLNQMRDNYNTELLLVRSVQLLAEMATLKQEGDAIQASGRNKDDRVIAAGLACYAWNEWIRPGMMAEKRDFRTEMASQEQREKSDRVVDHIIPNFMKERARMRDAAAWARVLGGDI